MDSYTEYQGVSNPIEEGKLLHGNLSVPIPANDNNMPKVEIPNDVKTISDEFDTK